MIVHKVGIAIFNCQGQRKFNNSQSILLKALWLEMTKPAQTSLSKEIQQQQHIIRKYGTLGLEVEIGILGTEARA